MSLFRETPQNHFVGNLVFIWGGGGMVWGVYICTVVCSTSIYVIFLRLLGSYSAAVYRGFAITVLLKIWELRDLQCNITQGAVFTYTYSTAFAKHHIK